MELIIFWQPVTYEKVPKYCTKCSKGMIWPNKKVDEFKKRIPGEMKVFR